MQFFLSYNEHGRWHGMRNKIILIILSIFLLFLLPSVQAGYYKMTLKECNYSFNDLDFGAWNEAEQKGLFLRIENLNPNLDSDNLFPATNLNYTTFQPPKPYYNNLGGYNPAGKWPYNMSSKIPFLNFKDGSNYIYIKCIHKIGNYRIFPMYYHPLYAASGLWATQDFNLSIGIINTTTYINYYQNLDPISLFYRGGSQWDYAATPYYVDNQVSSKHGYSDIIGGDGFYPNTEVMTITKADITSAPSGILQSYAYFRENGHNDLYYSNPLNYFYINSPLKITIEDNSFKPTFARLTAENKNTSKKFIYNDGNTRFLASPGDVIKVNLTLWNYNSFKLDNIIVEYEIHTENQWTRGVGTYYDSDPRIKLFLCNQIHNSLCNTKTYNITILNFSANEIISLVDEFTIPQNAGMPLLWAVGYLYKVGKSGYSPIWGVIGYDNITYIGFTSYDPRIEFSREKNSPVFKVNMYLFNPSYNPNVKLYPEEYNLSFIAVDSVTGNLAENFSIFLNANEFAKMKNGNLPVDNGRQYIPPNIDIPYTAEIVVDRTKYTGNNDHILYVYSVKNSGEFAGRIIGRIEMPPRFKSGDTSFYSGSNEYGFASNSKNSTRYLMIFNPSFYDTVMNISLVGLNSNFSAEYQSLIPLKPLESKIIPIKLDANHNPWPAIDYISSFIVKTAIPDQQKTVINNTLIYNIKVKNSSINFIDLSAVDLRYKDLDDPDYLNNSVEIEAFWDIQGSDSGFSYNSGKNYNVSIILKEKISGLVVGAVDISYDFPDSMTNIKTTELFSDLDRETKEYVAMLNVDSTNNIDEFDIDENSSENNNDRQVEVLLVTSNPFNPGGSCSKWLDIDFCNSKSLRPEDQQDYTCAWTSSYSSFSDTGDFCRGCSSINYCQSYINEPTCEADPCQKADCGALSSCVFPRCSWVITNTNDQKCLLNISGCVYEFKDLKKCEQGYETWEKEYQLKTGPSSCQSSLGKITGDCERVALDFFDFRNFIMAITSIFFIYILRILSIRNLSIRKKSLY